MTLSFPYPELVAHARANAPFYRELYTGLPDEPKLTDLPVLDHLAYWGAHHRDPQEILTAPLENGIVIGSGGTTGAPKFAYYDDGDWDRGILATTVGLETIGLRDGDRVANLFAAGEMYGSFMGATSSLKLMRSARVLQLPISQLAPDANAVRLIRHFKADTLAGFPTRLLRLLAYMEAENITDVPIRRLIFAGESFYPAQRAALAKRFPGIQIKSLGYASVDAGMMAFADDSCGPDEHRTLHGAGILEILDEETGEPINEPGRPGRIVFTNLTRRLQPALRYPSGDTGQWVEDPRPDARGVPADRCKFVLTGRVQQSARLAYTNIEMADLAALLARVGTGVDLRQHQVQIEQIGTRDRLTLRLVAGAPREELERATPGLLDSLYREKPNLLRMQEAGALHPVEIAWITAADLVVNERTGKLRAIVDLRRQ